MVTQAPQWVDVGSSGKEEPVIYYRRKNGWITNGATQPTAQLGMIRKGAMPLPQYGRITDSEDFWGPILRHPDGPAEFPVEQVLAYRWYRRDMLPDLRPFVMQGREKVRQGGQPKVVFPQLKGITITEFPCPECTRAFHSPLHLGSHLRVMHGYDRSEVLKYGEAMHIDFSKVPGGKEVVSYEFGEDESKEVIADAEEDFSLVSVSAEQPASAETAHEFERLSCDECDWVSKAGGSKPEFALTLHKKGKHEKKEAVLV
jgi:hypothetical protein